MCENDVLKCFAAKVGDLNVNVLLVCLKGGRFGGGIVGCICDVDLEDPA